MCVSFNEEPEIRTFPTEARERQKEAEKERKEKGIDIWKRKKYVKPHYDDCGKSLDGSGPHADAYLELIDSDTSLDEPMGTLSTNANGLEDIWLRGSRVSPGIPLQPTVRTLLPACATCVCIRAHVVPFQTL